MLALLTLALLVIGGGLSAPVLSRADENTAEFELLFDPSFLKQHLSLTDADNGERPVLPLLLPDTKNPYQPYLEDEYY